MNISDIILIMIISHSNCAGPSSSERYRLIQNISHSDYSQVDLVERLDTKEHFISKLHKTSTNSTSSFQFLNEIEAMRKLTHKNLIRLHLYEEHGQFIEDRSHIYDCSFYLTDYYPQGDLLSLVLHNPEGINESVARTLFSQIVKAQDYMHSMDLAHGDIRLENCLVTNEGEIKLTDFEFCKSAHTPCRVFEGSNYYKAPEIIRQEEYLPYKSDIFSSGCILYSLIFGCPAFESATLNDKWYLALTTRPDRFWNYIEKRSKKIKYELRWLIENMLSSEPSERLEFKEILQSSWMIL